MNQLVRGTFYDADTANAAVERLIALGYPRSDVNVIMSSEARGRYFPSEGTGSIDGEHVARAATGGGVIGAALGAIIAAGAITGGVAATVATGGLAAPFVAGPIAAALAGAVGGSAIGALVGAAGSEEEKERLQRDLEKGAIIVAVETRDHSAAETRRILDSQGASATYEDNALGADERAVSAVDDDLPTSSLRPSSVDPSTAPAYRDPNLGAASGRSTIDPATVTGDRAIIPAPERDPIGALDRPGYTNTDPRV